MNGRRSLLAAAAIALLTALVLLTGCSSKGDGTDVVAKFSKSSFAALLDAAKDKVSWSVEDSSWVLESPGGDKFLLAVDFSRNSSKDSMPGAAMPDMAVPDAELVFDAAPFLAAGLDQEKLATVVPADSNFIYEIEDGMFMLHFELGSAAFAGLSPEDAAKEGGFAKTFDAFVASQRARIGYHAKLDHYNIALGGGNMIEWAKDMAKNDKDLVFVLEPAPLIAAGLDPAKLEGWIYADVAVVNDTGKEVLVKKLLRPFDLK